MVADGEFREDLWYRVNTFEIAVPPLRDRAGDVVALARHLAVHFGAPAGEDDEIFSPDTLDALQQHVWPGNVRELANVIEHAMILRDDGPIAPEHLPQRFGTRPLSIATPGASAGLTLRQIEMQAIHDALNRHDGNKSQTAEELGVSLKTLYNKLNQAASLNKSA